MTVTIHIALPFVISVMDVLLHLNHTCLHLKIACSPNRSHLMKMLLKHFSLPTNSTMHRNIAFYASGTYLTRLFHDSVDNNDGYKAFSA